VREFGRRCTEIQADIRDIKALRAAADQTEREFGKVDIVVADAAIQRLWIGWAPSERLPVSVPFNDQLISHYGHATARTSA
jgi:NAD(P)-dependent dehydrogenase (short-subunit alcohol dehydrogenase family)